MNSKKGVPSPWTSVAVNENADGCSVNVWGRKYEIKDNLLFSSVSSLGDELLNSPMRISASENGKAICWNDTEVFLAESNCDKAIIYATSQSEAFIVNTATVIEFDGFHTANERLLILFVAHIKHVNKHNVGVLHVAKNLAFFFVKTMCLKIREAVFDDTLRFTYATMRKLFVDNLIKNGRNHILVFSETELVKLLLESAGVVGDNDSY